MSLLSTLVCLTCWALLKNSCKQVDGSGRLSELKATIKLEHRQPLANRMLRLWYFIPKHFFCCKERLKFFVSWAVCFCSACHPRCSLEASDSFREIIPSLFLSKRFNHPLPAKPGLHFCIAHSAPFPFVSRRLSNEV